MAFVQVSASVQTTGATSLSPSLTGVTSGNTLVYGISMWHSSAPTSTPPTNYTEQVESSTSANTSRVAEGYRLSAPSGTNTPSIGLASSSWGRAYLLEYGPLDTPTGSNTSTGNGTSISSGAVTPSGSTSMLIAVGTHCSDPVTITPGGSWVQRAESENQSAGQAISIIELTGVTGSQTASWTASNTAGWNGCVVSYPPGGAAPPAAGRTLQLMGAGR